jgi:hypothetical protein
MTAASLSIKDPTAEVVPRTGLWASLAEAMIHDPRDAPFLELMTTARGGSASSTWSSTWRASSTATT